MIYLNDIEFLRRICSEQHQTIYTKVDLLDINETPLTSLEGIVTGGNVSFDGTTALTRTCSLSLNAPTEGQISSFEEALNSKIAIYIGVKNNTEQYADFSTIYFPMGIYYLNNFSLSVNSGGYAVSLSGKDKMCKLTGELGGLLNATTDFGAIDVVNLAKRSTVKESIPIKKILIELIHFYGHEPYDKIFINDIDDYGLNLITYRGDEPLYYFIQFKTDDNGEVIPYITNCRFMNNLQVNEKNTTRQATMQNPIDLIGTQQKTDLISFNILKTLINNENLEAMQKINLFSYDYNNDSFEEVTSDISKSNFYDYMDALAADVNNDKFMIGHYQYGDTIGYELTELIYPGDLIANPGDAVTSILDKIKKMLGNYIYFYDLYGNFVFKKRNEFLKEDQPLNISFSPKKPDFILTDHIINSFSYSYNLNNIKNDYTVWGEQKLVNGVTADIHARIAIDEKPKEYTTLNITQERAEMLVSKYAQLYYNDKSQTKESVIQSLIQEPIGYYEETYSANGIQSKKVDWREIIYQMAVDYNRFNQVEEYADWLAENNIYYQHGETGYERYYTDLLGFWRTLYMPEGQVKVQQLQELKSNDNIEYSIQLVERTLSNGEKDNFTSFTATTKNIKDLLDSTADENKLLKELGIYNLPTPLELQRYKGYDLFDPNYYKNITWDIESSTIPNIMLYRKIYNQNTNKDEYIQVGMLNDIIKTNYKILGYMFYILSPLVYYSTSVNKQYLLREDVDTHEKTIWGDYDLWAVMSIDAPPENRRFKVYNNALWSLGTGSQITPIGIYYDITTLYYNAKDVVSSLDIDVQTLYKIIEEEIVKTNGTTGIIVVNNDYNTTITPNDNNYKNFLINQSKAIEKYLKGQSNELTSNLETIYLPIKQYPQNKDGNSLTNIGEQRKDKMVLLLWARANNILIEHDSNYQSDGFHKDILEQPDKLKFWFDFLSPDKFNQKFSVRNIGPREIVKKDTAVNCISTVAVPDMIFINPNKSIASTAEQQFKIQQSYFRQVRPNSSFLHLDVDASKKNTIAYTTKSAIDVIINLIYDHALAPTQLTLTGIPQYYLTTDALLYLLGDKTKGNKQYLINRISFSLDHGAMMNITLQEFVDNIMSEQLERDVIIDV